MTFKVVQMSCIHVKKTFSYLMNFANIVTKGFFSHEYKIFKQHKGHLRYDRCEATERK